MGRVLLSGLSDRQALEMLRRSQGLAVPMMEELSALEGSVKLARAQGYAIVDNELERGLISIAAPVRDSRRNVVAAINVCSQTNRISAKAMKEMYLPVLLDTAQKISSVMVR